MLPYSYKLLDNYKLTTAPTIMIDNPIADVYIIISF